jgi:hypothetical protein
VLLDHANQLVIREELRRKLWPNDAFGDFDQGLHVATSKLREVLGDSADSPTFVETVAPDKQRDREIRAKECPLDRRFRLPRSKSTVLCELTGQFLSFCDVTSQDGVLIHGAPFDGFPAPSVLYPNRIAIPVQADRPR